MTEFPNQLDANVTTAADVGGYRERRATKKEEEEEEEKVFPDAAMGGRERENIEIGRT